MLIRSKHLALIATCVMLAFAVAPSLFAQGGGIANYEVGTPNVAEAYAGQAAVARDASTAFLNPAGMTRLKGTHMLMGSEIALLSSGFTPDGFNTVKGVPGWRVGGPMFIPGGYFVGGKGDKLRFGFSFNSPFAIKVDYEPTWVGRYLTSYVSFVTLEARPSVAYRVNNWLSLGFALSMTRGALRHKQAVANILDPGFSDGLVDVNLHDWGVGTNYSVLLEPSGRTRIGMTYRSQIKLKLEGKVSVSNIGPNLGAYLASAPRSDTHFYLPQGANVSLYHEVSGKLALLADAGYTNWSVFGRTETKAANGAVLVTDRNWRDTFRVGLGMRCKLSDRATFQAGTSYDTSPVCHWNRTPDAPMDRELRYATGMLYNWKPTVTLGMAFEYKDMGPARIQVTSPTGTGVLSGIHEHSRMPFISLTMMFGPKTI